jgi:hypothetical protein
MNLQANREYVESTREPVRAGIHPVLECPMWRIKGSRHIITDFTLRHQRGYFQHPDGHWSKPKDDPSDASPADDYSDKF